LLITTTIMNHMAQNVNPLFFTMYVASAAALSLACVGSIPQRLDACLDAMIAANVDLEANFLRLGVLLCRLSSLPCRLSALLYHLNVIHSRVSTLPCRLGALF
jgi:hypothetical protein